MLLSIHDIGSSPNVNDFVLGQISKARQLAQDSKYQAKDLQDRINNNMERFKREKNKTWKLTQQAKAYLTGQCLVACSGLSVLSLFLNVQIC